jgi:hypothetical protein
MLNWTISFTSNMMWNNSTPSISCKSHNILTIPFNFINGLSHTE